MSNDSPLSVISGWLKSLPPEMRGEVALFVGNSLSAMGQRFNFWENDSGDKFTDWVEELSGSASAAAGKAVCIRALIDFCVVRLRGSNGGWSNAAELNKDLIREATANPGNKDLAGLAQVAERFLREKQFREKQWLSFITVWTDLRNGPISDNAIESWKRENYSFGL